MSELSWVSWLVPISVFFAWWYLNIRWLKTIVGFLFSIIFNYCCGSNMQYDHMHLYIIHISCNITCFARSDTASDLFFSSVPVKPCTAVELRMFYYVQLSCLECYNSSWDGFFFFCLVTPAIQDCHFYMVSNGWNWAIRIVYMLKELSAISFWGVYIYGFSYVSLSILVDVGNQGITPCGSR